MCVVELLIVGVVFTGALSLSYGINKALLKVILYALGDGRQAKWPA